MTWKTWTKHAVGAVGLLYLLSLPVEHHDLSIAVAVFGFGLMTYGIVGLALRTAP